MSATQYRRQFVRLGKRTFRKAFGGAGAGAIAGGLAKRGKKDPTGHTSAVTVRTENRGIICFSQFNDPFPKRWTVSLRGIAHTDLILNDTTLARALIMRCGLNQMNMAKLDLNGTPANEANGVANTLANGTGWHQYETPQFFDQIQPLYAHYMVNWARHELWYENVSNTVPLTLYYLVVGAHGVETTTVRDAPTSEAGVERLRMTPGMRCIELPLANPAKSNRVKITMFSRRKELVSKAQFTVDKVASWTRGTSETDDGIGTNTDIPMVMVWAFNANAPATPIPTATLRLFKATCTWNVTFFGRIESALAGDNPDA